MKKLLIIGVLLMILLGVFFKNNFVDVYYSISNKDEVVYAQKNLLMINKNDFEKVRENIFSESKLLTGHILTYVANDIQKIHLDSGKVARVATLQDDEFHSIIEVVFFYENNYSARIRVILILEKQSGLLKVKDIFFNDAYFVSSTLGKTGDKPR